MSCRLENNCTNNQAECEYFLFGLEILQVMDVHHVLALGDPLLVLQQVTSVYQYLEGSLNIYLDKCLGIIKHFDVFRIRHMSDTHQRGTQGRRPKKRKTIITTNLSIFSYQKGQW